MKLKREIKQELNGLVKLGSSTAIAHYLEEVGAYGYPSDEHACPLAVYLQSKLTDASISVNTCSVHGHRVMGFQDCMVEMPDRLKTFIESFDEGDFPDLIAH